MKNRQVTGLISWVLPAALLLGGCRDRDQLPERDAAAASGERPLVMALSYPLFDMARELAGDRVTIEYPIPEELTCETWKPDAAEIRRLQSATAVLLSGAGYEPWLQTVSLPHSRTIDTSAAYASRLLRLDRILKHQHGPDGESAGGELVWATWLDPELALAQLRQVETLLKKLDAGDAQDISRRAAELTAAIDRIDKSVTELAEKISGKAVRVLVDAPDYGYLLRRLNLSGRLVRLSPDSHLTGDDPDEIETQTDSNTVSVLLHRSGVEAGLLKRIRSSGVVPVEIDLCEEPVPDQGWLPRLRGNLERLAQALGDSD